MMGAAGLDNTVLVLRMANRKWIETEQQPGTAEPGNMLGCCIIYFHFRWGKLSTRTVDRDRIALEWSFFRTTITL